MQFTADTVSFQEYAIKEPLPLSVVHESILDFIRGRDDVALSGAHAVNAYAGDPRATQDVDLLSTNAAEVADQLRNHLAERFQVALRVREQEQAFRIDQVREEGNRHLVDLRQVPTLPQLEKMEGIQVLGPASLIASKVLATHRRRGRPKSMTDARDLALLLLRFPELKRQGSSVEQLLADEGADVLEAWKEWVSREILPELDDY